MSTRYVRSFSNILLFKRLLFHDYKKYYKRWWYKTEILKFGVVSDQLKIWKSSQQDRKAVAFQHDTSKVWTRLVPRLFLTRAEGSGVHPDYANGLTQLDVHPSLKGGQLQVYSLHLQRTTTHCNNLFLQLPSDCGGIAPKPTQLKLNVYY